MREPLVSAPSGEGVRSARVAAAETAVPACYRVVPAWFPPLPPVVVHADTLYEANAFTHVTVVVLSATSSTHTAVSRHSDFVADMGGVAAACGVMPSSQLQEPCTED